MTLGTVVASLFWIEAEIRYLDPWVGTTTDAAELLDQEKAMATAWIVWGSAWLVSAAVVRRGATAAALLAVGLLITVGAGIHWLQVDAELSDLVAPQDQSSQWLELAVS